MAPQLWTYGALAYGITWIVALVIETLHARGIIDRAGVGLLHNLGALGPLVGAVTATAIHYGRPGLRALLATLAPSRIDRRSLLLALSPLLLFALGLLVHLLLTGSMFSFAITRREFDLSTAASYLGWGMPFIIYALFEEIGWRGFVLPHLQQRYSALASSAILALIWGVWHAPMFLYRLELGVGTTVGFAFGLFVGAIVLTSIFNLSRGSTLAAMIFHGANNIASAFDREYIVATVSTGLVVVAVYLLVVFKSKDLADVERVRNYFSRRAEDAS